MFDYGQRGAGDDWLAGWLVGHLSPKEITVVAPAA